MKKAPNTPTWLPVLLHFAHALIAVGVGYSASYAAVVYWYSEAGSLRSLLALTGTAAFGVFEIGLLAWMILRRRRMRNLWKEASKAIRDESWEVAKLALTELLTYSEYRLSPQPVLFALGAVAEGEDDSRKALTLYRQCGDFPASLRQIGLMQLERGLNDSAADAFRKLLAKRPNDTLAAVMLALALVRNRSRDAAIKLLQRQLEKRPKSKLLRVNLDRIERGIEPELRLDLPIETDER